MLVLSRRERESIVVGDEVTLIVEEIAGSDGRRIFGARVRLGFQSPPYVSVRREDWHTTGEKSARSNQPREPAQPRPGKLVEISDAQVRLRIQVPQKIPVLHNGKSTVGRKSEETLDGASRPATVVHYVTCHKDDRITICNNITVATLDFQRFIRFDRSRRFARQGSHAHSEINY